MNACESITRRTILALALAAGIPARAAELPDGFVEAPLAEGLTGAVAMAIATDGRIFVCEQTGSLRVIKGGVLLPEPFVTVKVDSHWERGLIGVTLDPRFPETPYVYVTTVAAEPYPHHRILRFTARGDAAVPGSEKVLLEGDDQNTLGGSVKAGHQGGGLRFGPDGKLYIGIGEQTAGMPAQRLDTFQGKLLRINPDGTIPADNPFHLTASGKYRAIWAIGLRNPFLFAFQPGTDRLFINDVGEAAWEEINEGAAGANYGWPHAEGPSTNRAFRAPLHAYGHGMGKSITGGTFYNPPVPQFPPAYVGKYFFTDYGGLPKDKEIGGGWIRVLDPEKPKSAAMFATGLARPVDLQVGPDGSLYYLVRNAWVRDRSFVVGTGSLFRIRYAPAEAPKRVAAAEKPPWRAALGLPEDPDELPPRLSETGVFGSMEPLRPAAALARYELNVPAWLDGAAAARWMALPPGGRAAFSAGGALDFPRGTLFVQHIEMPLDAAAPEKRRRLETRLLVVGDGGQGYGASYRWRADGRDADLVESQETEEISVRGGDGEARAQTWSYPGRYDCLSCHTVSAGFVLGVKTAQMNRAAPASRENQLAAWARAGLLDRAPGADEIARLPRLAPMADAGAPLEQRVRSYLDVNCAHCHRPSSHVLFDARFETPLPKQKLVDGALVASNLEMEDPRIVAPGDPARSVLLERLRRRDVYRMPPLGRDAPDAEAAAAVEAWIRGLAPVADNINRQERQGRQDR